jgi:hypothetical protein
MEGAQPGAELLLVEVGCTWTGLHATIDAPSTIAASNDRAGFAMWVVFLEMGVALGMLLLIVWWTWPKKRARAEDKDEEKR